MFLMCLSLLLEPYVTTEHSTKKEEHLGMPLLTEVYRGFLVCPFYYIFWLRAGLESHMVFSHDIS